MWRKPLWRQCLRYIDRTILAAAKVHTIKLSYRPGENVYEHGALAQFVYAVDMGALFRFQLFPGNRRSVRQFLFPGDGFGHETGRHHRETVQALVQTDVLAVGRDALVAAAASNLQLANLMFKATVRTATTAVEQADALRVKTARERIALFLLEMDARLSARGRIYLPMFRHQIADYLGLRVETLSRELSALQKEEIIRFLDGDQRQLVICNKQSLLRIASNALGFDCLTDLRKKKARIALTEAPTLQALALSAL